MKIEVSIRILCLGLVAVLGGCETEDADAEPGTDLGPEPPPSGPPPPGSVTIAPTDFDFGNVVVNSEATRIIEVSSSSLVAATIEFLPTANIEVCGQANISAFCLVQPTSDFQNNDEIFPLRPGETRRLELRFKPTVANAEEQSAFVLRYCPQDDCTVEISATGFSVEKPVRCEPEALSFGAVNPGSRAEAVVTCTANANQQVTITSARIGGNSSPDFAQDPPIRGTTLHPPTNGNPGASVAIPVSYMPETLGEDAGVLIIETDDADPLRGRLEVPLQGFGGGPRILVEPELANFGLAALLVPTRRTVLVRNVGFEDLEIEVEIENGSSAVFSSVDLGAGLIPPGESRALEIRFQATAEEVFNGLLVISSNDPQQDRVDLRLRGEGIDLDPCPFALSPTLIDFGSQQVGRTYEQGFEVRNLSDEVRCLVTSIDIDSSSDPQFELGEVATTGIFIEPGATLAVPLVFAPIAPGAVTGRVEIGISSPQTPLIAVGLAGAGTEEAGLLARDLDFGTVPPGCRAETRTLSLYNESGAPFTLGSIDLNPESDGFTILDRPDLPIQIPSNGRLQIELGFDPGAGPASDFVGGVVLREDPSGSAIRTVGLLGSTRDDGLQRDTFEQLGRSQVDILFVIDDSGSLTDEQDDLRENFDSFIKFAEAQALGYHIGVIGTDRLIGNGRLRPLSGNPMNRVVRPQTQPSPRQVFLQNADVGVTGVQSVPLQAAYNALRPPLLDRHNAGFLRREAVLSIIAVTGGRDFSNQDTDFYLEAFRAIKGSQEPRLVSFSAIAGNEDCEGTQPAPRLQTLVQATGGIEESVCTEDWSRFLEELSQPVFGFRSRFLLTKAPVPETLQVFVDDELLVDVDDSGQVSWTFDEEQLAIDFRPLSVPGAGTRVRIEYASAACEQAQ
ncbi:MAG: choice-of-anchor D domain-containing protein [Myxococcota bacterium]